MKIIIIVQEKYFTVQTPIYGESSYCLTSTIPKETTLSPRIDQYLQLIDTLMKNIIIVRKVPLAHEHHSSQFLENIYLVF
jgi:dynactin complex subunit